MRQRRAAATGGSVVRGREPVAGDGNEGKVREGPGQLRGDARRCPGRRGGRQAGWRWPGACRRAVATRAAFWREEEGDRSGAVGWAGLLQWWARGKFFLSLSFFLFLFCFISFATLFN